MAQNALVETSSTETGQWLTWVKNEVESTFSKVDLNPTDYQLRCAKEAFEAVKNTIDTTKDLDANLLADQKFLDNVAQVFSNCASLELSPARNEVFFQFRNVQTANGKWTKRLEMGIQGNGFETLVTRYGYGVKEVGRPWEVMDSDDFEFPEYNGLEVVPPKWKRHSGGKKHIIIVYPVMMKNKSVEYAIAERNDVMPSLFAHVKQSLQNVTFGIAESRYKATKEQQSQIDAKKKEILDALKKCDSVDEMLECEIAQPYMSPAWIDSSESMILRKMKNKALKKFKLDFNVMQNDAFNYSDETYKSAHAEIEENENSQEFFIEGEAREVAQVDS